MIMMEETKHDMEEEGFESLLLESDVRGYLYELQYSLEQLRLMKEQETPGCRSRRPDWVELGGLLLPVLSLRVTAYGHRVRLLQRISTMAISPGGNL